MKTTNLMFHIFTSALLVMDILVIGLGIAGIVVTISGCRKIKRQSKM